MLPIILFLVLHSYTPERTSHLYSHHAPNIACTEENHCFAWSKEHKCCKTDSSSNGVSMYKYTELYFSQSCQAEYFAVRALKLTGFFFVYFSFGSFPPLSFWIFSFFKYMRNTLKCWIFESFFRKHSWAGMGQHTFHYQAKVSIAVISVPTVCLPYYKGFGVVWRTE